MCPGKRLAELIVGIGRDVFTNSFASTSLSLSDPEWSASVGYRSISGWRATTRAPLSAP